MDYYFGEHLRWNLGWETPNQGGAFIATLLPGLWALVVWVWGRAVASRGARARLGWTMLGLVIFAGEAAGTYALARTYSRGALAGVVLGGASWAIFVWRGRRRREEAVVADSSAARSHRVDANIVPWGARVALFALCLGLTGFHERVAPGHLVEDRSSTNRLVLWRGGAELVAASPLRGWGWGQSGASFMHWTQPLDRSEGYLSMVNSYLTVAVEAGLPFFALVLAGVLLPLVRQGAAEGTRAEPGAAGHGGLLLWGRACVAVWATWLGCLFFSNLWIIRPLWWTPGLAAAGLLVAWPHSWRTWVRASAGAAGASLLLTLLLGLGGAILAAREPVCLRRDAEGRVMLTLREDANMNSVRTKSPRSERVLVLPDAAVLGESYGQELRRWLLADERLSELVILTKPELRPRAWDGVTAVVACGASCADPVLEASPVSVWLLHPTVEPPSSPPGWVKGGWVNVPGIDVSGQASVWWPWAGGADIAVRVRVTPGVAGDVRPQWPRLALAAPWREVDK